jgi:hypothetical protein
MSYENKYWDKVEHNPFSPEWAIYLDFAPLVLPVIDEKQKDTLISSIVESNPPTVHWVKVNITPEYNHLLISQIVEAETDEDALKKATRNALGELALVGKNVDHIEFQEAHLALCEQISVDSEQDPNVAEKLQISDRRYTIEGPWVTSAYDDAYYFALGLQHDLLALSSL